MWVALEQKNALECRGNNMTMSIQRAGTFCVSSLFCSACAVTF